MQSSMSGAVAPCLEPDSSSTIRRPGLVAVGQGQPVVLLHGSMSSKGQWKALMHRLAPRFQAIAVDLHGYGDNPPPTTRRSFSVDDEIDFVLSRLDDVLGRQTPMHLVGHSYGGLVALRFAQRYRTRALSLALYEPMVLSLFAADDPVARCVHQGGRTLTAFVNMRRNHEAAQVCIDLWSGEGTFETLPLPARAKSAAAAPQTALNYEAEVCCPMQLDDFRSIHTPTLLLGGARSPEAVQRIVTMLSTALPNSSVNWLDANHMAPIGASELVDPSIATFIATVAARTRDPGGTPGTKRGD